MFTTVLSRVNFTNSVLSAIKRYRGTIIQDRMHEYHSNEAKVAELKSRVNYEIVNKESQGAVMIREFLFQEEKPSVKVNFPLSYVTPTGKWSLEDLQKFIEAEGDLDHTPSEEQNIFLIDNFQEKLAKVFKAYYDKEGKKNYTLLVKEQVQKISELTPEEFQAWMDRLESTYQN